MTFSAYSSADGLGGPDSLSLTQFISGKRVMMAVSLGSRRFTLTFMHALQLWLKGNNVKSIMVVLFDRCESINYSLFRSMPTTAARERASLRATELQRAFSRHLAADGLLTKIVLESDIWNSMESPIPSTYEAIRNCYATDQIFRSDVHKQVIANVGPRLLKDPRFGEESFMDLASEYILCEVAVFDVLFRSGQAETEVYPGSSLFIKDMMWRGCYQQLPALSICDRTPTFIDVSFLCEEVQTKPLAVTKFKAGNI